MKVESGLAVGLMVLCFLSPQICHCGLFGVSGYENLTGPGDAHLVLTATSLQESWANHSLRVEISGAMAATLIYPVQTRTDLGCMALDSGNYTLDVYVLEDFGATVEESGSVAAHEQISFSIPEPPEPEKPKEPIITLVNLGFMITALFIFGLILAIWRTTVRRTGTTAPTLGETGTEGL